MLVITYKYSMHVVHKKKMIIDSNIKWTLNKNIELVLQKPQNIELVLLKYWVSATKYNGISF